MQHVNEFKSAMEEYGITPPDDISGDGKLHRFGGKGSKNGWYVLFTDSDISAGEFGDWKLGIRQKWCSKTKSEFTPEQRKEYAAKMAAARKQRQEEQTRVQAECRAWCNEAWAKAEAAPDDHPYLKKKQVPSFGLKKFVDALLVPIKDSSQNMHGIQFIHPDGSKVFKTGTDYAGNCFRIGQIKDNTIIIGEGYATCASVHMATGHAVLVAFVAGNLKAVATVVRSKAPNMRIIIAADNDAWHKQKNANDDVIAWHETPCTIDGRTYENTGRVKGYDTARSVGGLLVVPHFKDTTTHPTDFNDLHLLEGLDAVKRQFNAAMNPIPEEPPPPNDDDYLGAEPEAEQDPEQEIEALQPSEDECHFTCLGYDNNVYYYLPRGSRQVVPLRAEQHCESHLITLAPLNWWETRFHGKQGANFKMAANALVRRQEEVGVYDPRRIRGRGAWEDHGRSVLHRGDILIVDGKKTGIHELKTRHIYEAAAPMEIDRETRPLSPAEANKFVKLCDMLTWEREIYGRLLAGWCIVAPICGSLLWRPHVWITGASGTGKSWCIDNILRPAVGPAALLVQSNTTEAGLRQELRNDARPVIFDEAEGEDQLAQRRIQNVLELMRQASSENGASILKGTATGRALSFRIRSCFAFSSIGVNLNQQADASRVTVLSLVKRDSEEQTERVKRFQAIKKAWAELMTPEYCCALRARAVLHIPIINQNAGKFARAAAELLGSQRVGDQLGAILAGAYCCFSSGEVSLDAAREWVSGQNWGECGNNDEDRDEIRCLAKILQSMVRIQGARSMHEMSIGELITAAMASLNIYSDFTRDEADAVLKRHGIKVFPEHNAVAISNKHTAIERILEKTPWAKNWGRILARLPDSMSTPAIRFAAGPVSRAVMLHMNLITGE